MHSLVVWLLVATWFVVLMPVVECMLTWTIWNPRQVSRYRRCVVACVFGRPDFVGAGDRHFYSCVCVVIFTLVCATTVPALCHHLAK
jgi:hypothetical protein